MKTVGRLLLVLLFCLSGAVAVAQHQPLRVAGAGDEERSWPVELLGVQYYVSRPHATELLRFLDPELRVSWDPSTGIFRAESSTRSFSLTRQDNYLIFNNAMIETPGRLVAARGQIFVPLSSLFEILRRLGDVRSNIQDFLREAPAPGAGDAVDAGDGEDRLPLYLPGEAPGVDIRSIVDSIALISGEKATPSADFNAQLRLAAKPLLERQTIVIDPQPRSLRIALDGDEGMARPGTAADPGPDLTLRIARRCREILAQHQSVRIVLTRENQYEAPPLDERLRVINGSDARALICLRVDQSPFPENRGYRIHVAHRAVDPEGMQFYSVKRQKPGALPLSAQYTPYDNLSLVFSRLMDGEFLRAGMVPASDKIKLAPLWLLKRAAMPALSISIGYSSNSGDLDRFADDRHVESVAASLAQGILALHQWLEQTALEAE
jgi:N-acetylmuramoyl-L-alanine amidase